MTEYDVSTDIEAIVEDTDLPRRLKNEVYSTLEERTVTVEEADEIVQATEARYKESRVDPLDPVGTVSAQSIGEPGTQMSVSADERVIVRRGDETDVTEIGPLVDGLCHVRETQDLDSHEVARAPEDLEVLSLRADERVEWKPVEEVSRHAAPDELLEFELESGRSIRATKSHSFVTRRDNEIVPVTGEELETDEWLPVVGSFDVQEGLDAIDIKQFLPSDEYWYTSALTDGGTATVPGGEDQLRNKRDALEAGEIDDESVYPRQGTVGLPERFPLDEETGFFLGAFLAEGSVTEYYVSISNVDDTFQSHIRKFADRFDLTVNEYGNDSGFAEGYDIRVNGKVLADFVQTACLDSETKAVPDFAFGASDEFVRGLLSGYFSGDGNVAKRRVRASSTSERLSEGIALLLARENVYATRSKRGESHVLRIPSKHVRRFNDYIGMVGKRGDELETLTANIDPDGPDSVDQIPNFGDALKRAASEAGIPSRQVNSAHNRQRIGRNRLTRLIEEIEKRAENRPEELDGLERAVRGDVIWERIESIDTIEPDHEYVYDFSVEGLETFTTAQGVVTHNTMNTFHYAGVAEIDVTQGLPRLIELVDARKEPDTPMMTVHLDG
ncbi:MAG: DNA-directed RNA polymerase subunit A'', partial [Halovenus sp.]